MPEFNDIRKYHGVIFVKKGLYRDGIFRFTLVLPKEYNDVNTYPEVTFTPPIFNPFIDPITGILDLKQDPDKSTWQPDKHYIRDALYFLKRSFYMKDFSVFEQVANEEARKLFKDDKESYAELVNKCVKESCSRMLDDPEGIFILILFV
jgi:ubiquitin-protein ligase